MPEDLAKSVAAWAGEGEICPCILKMLAEHSTKITGALGISQVQLDAFLGDEEE